MGPQAAEIDRKLTAKLVEMLKDRDDQVKLAALMAYLVGACGLSKRRVEEVVETVFEVPNDPAGGLAEGHQSADLGALLGRDRCTRLRHVDDADGQVDAVRHDQPCHGIA